MTDTDKRSGVKKAVTLLIHKKKGETNGASLARTATSPALGATLALHALHEKGGALFNEVGLADLLGELTRASNDDTSTGTDRLLAQAVVLDRVFTHMTAVAMQQEYLSGMTPALNLAFRAQAQCRATLQAVSDIRHPRQYIGQQNVAEQYNAGGHQQVNRDAHAGTTENRPTELSEGTTNELHPNEGAPSGVEGAGDALEAVGALDGAANN